MALVAALVLSVLYFALLTLLLADSSRELAAARRFRARAVAAVLAENGAELAAEGIVTSTSRRNEIEMPDGTVFGTMQKRADGGFTIVGRGTVSGLVPQESTVRVIGRVEGTAVRIDYTQHSR